MRLAFLTHEPFYPPSGGGSAEAIYLAQEFVRRGHEVHIFSPTFPDAETVAENFNVQLHLFTAWPMGRYARFRNFKYLLFPAATAAIVCCERSRSNGVCAAARCTMRFNAAGKRRYLKLRNLA